MMTINPRSNNENDIIMQRLTLSILLLSIAAPFLWSLDANPWLLIYDTYLSKTSSSTIQSSSNDGTIINRRLFPPRSNISIEGKTIWITGASSGIGAETALQLAYAGVGHLILSGRRRDKLDSVAESCRNASARRLHAYKVATGERISQSLKVSVVPFDMSAGSDILDSAVSQALEVASSIDVLILNAGQYHINPALETNLDEALPHLMQVNFASPVQLCQKLIQTNQWKERHYGHVVVISSLMGRGMSPLNALYSASKHALRGYFYGLAAEEQSWLRVDIVLPGATDTDLWRGSSMKGIDGTKEGGDTSNTDQKPLHADDRSKMPVHRCAQLIISSMIGPRFLFFESWITRNPGLLWVYLASYEPTTFHYVVAYIIAPLRMGMWRKYGEDALYLPTLLGHMWDCVLDYYGGGPPR